MQVVAADALLGIELIAQIHDAVEARPLALHHDLTSERRGQMRGAGSDAADQHDVARRAAQALAGKAIYSDTIADVMASAAVRAACAICFPCAAPRLARDSVTAPVSNARRDHACWRR